jgi:hypothetical protein
MTDNPPPGMSGPGEPEDPAARPQPWFPPSGEPGGYAPPPPPPPSAAPPGAAQPGQNGTAGSYGQTGYGPPPSYGQPGGYRPGGYGPPPQGGWQARAQAPKPGVIPLRPLGVGEILDGAFTSIRRNPRATLGLAAILLIMSTVVTTVFSVILVHYLGTITLPSPGQQLTSGQESHLLHRLLVVFVPIVAVNAVLGFIVHTVLTGLLTMVIGRGVLGQQITPGEAWRLARPRLLPLLGTTLLVLLVILGVWVVYALFLAILAAAGAAGTGAGTVALLGAIAAAVLTIWFGIMLVTSGSVTVLERERPARALARSWRLVRGSFWRVFGITVLAAIIVAVTFEVLQIPFNLIASTAGGGGSLLAGSGGSVTGAFIGAVGQVVAGAVVLPISAGVAVLLYVDLRMRREGLDLVLQTAAASGGVPAGDEFASLWRPGAAQSPSAPVSEGAPPGAPPAW